MKLLNWSFYLIMVLLSCQSGDSSTRSENIERPNILWIVAEDLSEYLPSFGDSTIQTPALSRLAAEGICYDQFFTPAAVCAPARSAIATGMYPTHLGTNHMRTGPWFSNNITQQAIDAYAVRAMPKGVIPYEGILPNGVKMMSEILREHGYYCTNNNKEDYQFRKSLMAWDESSSKAHWKNRQPGQPFFSIFNLGVTHESQIWARANDSLWVDEDLDVSVPPYLPDTEVGRRDIRRLYSNIKILDHQVGELIKELEEAGELDNTIVFWYSDHGGPLPRQKRLLYDSGIKVPMIIRFPDKRYAGTRNDDLTSFIDLKPTVLSLAGIQPSDDIDGKAVLGRYKRETPAKYVFAAADRFDETYDKNRAVRDKRYKYIRYYEPEKPMFLHVSYRDQMPIMQELYRLRDAGELTDAQKLWFRETKPEEELFDTKSDPHEIHNLADDPAYAEKLEELRNALERWQSEVPDLNFQDESEYFRQLWPDGTQPVTATPNIMVNNNLVTILSTTEYASLGYQILNPLDSLTNRWEVYSDPIILEPTQTLKAVAHKVGYLPSDIIDIKTQ